MGFRRTMMILVGIVVIVTGSAQASWYTMDFTNTTLDLGMNSQINLTNQYNSFGLNFENVYRGIDNRDPWDMFGIWNGWIEQNYDPKPVNGKVIFSSLTDSIAFDWLSLSEPTGDFHITAYDQFDNALGSFAGSGFGSNKIVAPDIKYLVFHDDGGFVSISNLSYDMVPSVPEPGTLALVGLGAVGLGFIRRRRS